MSLFKPPVIFLSKYCITLQCHATQLFCNFLAQTIYTFLKRGPILRLLRVGSKFTRFLVSFSKAQVSYSSNFVSFFNIMAYNSSALLCLTHNILLTKVAHQNAIFQICHSFHQNSPNSSCHFCNQESVFLQT